MHNQQRFARCDFMSSAPDQYIQDLHFYAKKVNHSLLYHLHAQRAYHNISVTLYFSEIMVSYLKMLTANVKLQAINATIKIPHKPCTLPQIIELDPLVPFLQLPLSSVRAANASAIFADSNMMNQRSSNTNRILAFGDLRPRGFPVYSSHVM
jgi:hypothetical protein